MPSNLDDPQAAPELSGNWQRKIREANIRVHDRLAETYEDLHAEVRNWFQRKALQRDIRIIASLLTTEKYPDEALDGKRPRGWVLDLGCGTGDLLLRFLNLGFAVTGVDISSGMIEAARWKLATAAGSKGPDGENGPGWELIPQDVDLYIKEKSRPQPGEFMTRQPNNSGGWSGDGFKRSSEDPPFSVICFRSVLHHLPDYLGTLEASLGVLAGGGILYIANEPLGREAVREGWLSYHVLYWLDRLFDQVGLHLKGLRPLGSSEYDCSDYHRRRGSFDHSSLIEKVKGRGLVVKHYREFSLRKTGGGSWLDTHLLRTANAFTLIAQKAPPE